MSQYIETSGVPRHDPSSKRRWSAVAGIAVAAALVAAAVGLINAQSEQAVPTAQPSVGAGLSSVELVETGQESLLAQFRAGEHAAQDQRYSPSDGVEAFEAAIAPTATSGGWVPDVRELPSGSAIAPAVTSVGWVPDPTQLSIEQARAERFRSHQLATSEAAAAMGVTSRVASSPHEIAEAQLSEGASSVTGVGWVPDPIQLSIEQARAERLRSHQLATSEGAAALGVTSRVASSPHEIAEAQLSEGASSVTGVGWVPDPTQLSIEKAIADQFRAQQMATPQGIAQLRAAELQGLYAAQFASTSEGTVAAGLAAQFDLPAFAEATAPSLPASVRGFEYNEEATAYQEFGTPVTTTYFGNSDELWPEESEPAAVSGFEYSDEATAYHEFAPPVTTAYFGNSGELWAE